MQINNKVWLNIVSRALFKGDRVKAYHALLFDPCMNIEIGTWILSINYKNNKGNIWKAVGEYHSRNSQLAKDYIRKVQNIHSKLFPDV